MRVSRSATRWLIMGVLAAGAVGAALAIAGVTTPARLPLVLIFLAAAPAFAVASLLGGLDRLAAVVIAGASALVINFGVADAMVGTGHWSARAGVLAVGVVSALIAAIGAVAARVAGSAQSRAGASSAVAPAASQPE